VLVSENPLSAGMYITRVVKNSDFPATLFSFTGVASTRCHTLASRFLTIRVRDAIGHKKQVY